MSEDAAPFQTGPGHIRLPEAKPEPVRTLIPQAYRRIGQFTIPCEVIDRQPQAVRKVLGTVIVVTAKPVWPPGYVLYTALCDEFDPIPDGLPPPSYVAEMGEIIPGTLSFKKWVRVSGPMVGEAPPNMAGVRPQ